MRGTGGGDGRLMSSLTAALLFLSGNSHKDTNIFPAVFQISKTPRQDSDVSLVSHLH